MVFPLKPPFSYGFIGLMFSTEVDRSRPARKPPRTRTSCCREAVDVHPLHQSSQQVLYCRSLGNKNRSDRGYNHRDLTPMFVGKYTLVNIQKDIEQGHY